MYLKTNTKYKVDNNTYHKIIKSQNIIKKNIIEISADVIKFGWKIQSHRNC